MHGFSENQHKTAFACNAEWIYDLRENDFEETFNQKQQNMAVQGE